MNYTINYQGVIDPQSGAAITLSESFNDRTPILLGLDDTVFIESDRYVILGVKQFLKGMSYSNHSATHQEIFYTVQKVSSVSEIPETMIR